MQKAWQIHRTLNHLKQVRWYTDWWLCVVVCSCKLQCTPLCSPLTSERWKLSWRRPLRWLKVHYGCLKRPPFWYIWNINWVNCILVRILDYEIAKRLTLDTSSRLWKNQGFNGIWTRDLRVTGALLYQLSYEATHWERGQFIEFISPVRSQMMWSIYETFHFFWTAVVDESEEWSSQ